MDDSASPRPLWSTAESPQTEKLCFNRKFSLIFYSSQEAGRKLPLVHESHRNLSSALSHLDVASLNNTQVDGHFLHANLSWCALTSGWWGALSFTLSPCDSRVLPMAYPGLSQDPPGRILRTPLAPDRLPVSTLSWLHPGGIGHWGGQGGHCQPGPASSFMQYQLLPKCPWDLGSREPIGVQQYLEWLLAAWLSPHKWLDPVLASMVLGPYPPSSLNPPAPCRWGFHYSYFTQEE